MAKSDPWGNDMAYQRKERAGFMVLHRCRLQLKYLSNDERGQLLSALLDYSELGINPDFSGTLGMAYDTMAEQIDFYAASYENRCQTNRRNRRTVVNDRRPSSTFVDNGDQSNQIKSKSKQNIPPISPKGDTHKDAFNHFWQAYPKKRDKQRAERAFTKAIGKTDLETMLQALEQQKRSPEWQKEGGQYVPLPSTWLNGCRWEDETIQQQTVYTYIPQPDILPEYND